MGQHPLNYMVSDLVAFITYTYILCINIIFLFGILLWLRLSLSSYGLELLFIFFFSISVLYALVKKFEDNQKICQLEWHLKRYYT